MMIVVRLRSLAFYRAAFYRATTLLAAVAVLAVGADTGFEIPPVPVSLNLDGQPVSVAVSGVVIPAEDARSFGLKLHADLADFQAHLTPVLQAELNRSDRCGERISIENATLAAAAPASRLTVQLHVEKWVCIKAFGKENPKRLLGGNGTVEVMLTPRIEDTATVKLDANVGRIDADGPLGDVLRSGSVGAVLKDKIRDTLQKSIQKAADMNAVVPEKARAFASLQSIAFADAGGGHVALDMGGRLQIPEEQVPSILEQFRSRK